MVVPGPKVVVVEDDDSMRQALERLLGAAGFQTDLFSTAEAALAGETATDTACVVSDLRLPGLSGLDLLAELGAHGRVAPFILITAHDTPGLRKEVARRGAAAYLVKPFLGTALLDFIRAAIRTARPQ
jgi:FixJ family two-component response regulator